MYIYIHTHHHNKVDKTKLKMITHILYIFYKIAVQVAYCKSFQFNSDKIL